MIAQTIKTEVKHKIEQAKENEIEEINEEIEDQNVNL